jgi:pSer/pThr/pTyr-binding forkhead associated (FHA) protein
LLLIARQGVTKQAAPVSPARRRPSPAAAPIEVSYGELRGADLTPTTLREGILSIGRGSDNDLMLDHPTVSRHHARIVCACGTCRVEDLDSSNGTFVDGKRVTSASLTEGSQVRFGDATLTLASPSRETTTAWLEIGEEHFPLSASEVTIGRSNDAPMRLTDQLASRTHARIDRRGSTFVLTDLNSTNGTFVNDRSVHDHVLRDGDRIRIGRTQLTFHG